MALNAYLKLKGQKQGIIKGSAVQKGKEGKIIVIAVSHEVTSPRDAASGQATGRRIHKPFVITKEIDKSTPLLYNALISNENITEFTLDFYTDKKIGTAIGVGVETQHYSVRLTNAKIADIKFFMLNNKNPEFVKFAEYEEVAFVYEKIEWFWKDGNIAAVDDWMSPI